MADPNQGFFLPEEKAGDYEAAEAFVQYWKPPNGSTLEYMIEEVKMGASQAGEARVEVHVVVASGEYMGSKPAAHSWPHKTSFLHRWKELNLATGVNPARDPATGLIPIVPAWYAGKRFIATAFWREAPNAKDPTKMNIYADLKNLMPVPQEGQQQAQGQPQMQAPQQQPVFQQQAAQPQFTQQAPQQAAPAFAPTQQPQQQAQPQFAQMQAAPTQQVPVRRTVPGT